MVITTRDQELLRILNRYSILSSQQIRNLCFSNIRKTTMHRRLRALERNSLIRRSYGLKGGESVWALDKEGGSFVGSKVPLKNFNRNTLEHDLALASVQMVLEKHGSGNKWSSEWEIKCEGYNPRNQRSGTRQVIPDGIFVIDQKDKPLVVAVELELSLKTPSRYKETFQSYSNNPGFFLVWYVVRNKAVGDVILRQWVNKFKNSTYCHLAYSTIEQVLNDFWVADIFFGDKTHKLYEVLRLNKILYDPAHTGDLSVSIQKEENKNLETSQAIETLDKSGNPTPQIESSSVADPSPPTSKERGGKGSATTDLESGVGVPEKKEVTSAA